MPGATPFFEVLAWAAVLVTALLAVLVWLRRPPPQLWPGLFWYYAAAALYTFGSNVGNLGLTIDTIPEVRRLSIALTYAGIMTIPPLYWLVTLGCAEWMGYPVRWARGIGRYGPFVVPAVFWPAMVTNPWHGLFTEPRPSGFDVYLPLWYVYAGAAYVVTLGSIVLLSWLRWRTRHTPRAGQVTVLLVAMLVPWVVNMLTLSGIITLTVPNPTVIAISVTGVLFAVAIYRQRLFALSKVTLQQLVDQDVDAVVALNEHGRLHYANAVAREMVGADMLGPEDDVLAALAPRLSLESTPEAPLDRAALLARLAEPAPSSRGHLFRFAHDSCPWVRIASITARDGRGRVQGYGLRVRDVTEQRRHEKEEREMQVRLQETHRLESLAKMAGGVAHDFNNLLMGVLGNAELALKEADPTAPIADRLHGIRVASERAAALTAQMLAYTGRKPFTPEQVDLMQLVSQMRDLHHTLVSTPVQMEYELAPVPIVWGDATQLHQIITALCINAGEALEEDGGTITFRTGTQHLTPADLPALAISADITPGSYAFVEVQDTGCGMDAEHAQRVFDPFFSTKFTGRGLGLAAVHGIARAHRGTIRVTTAPGQGTTFTLLLPAAETRDTPTPAPEAPVENLHGTGTVLVVDDDPSVRDIAAGFLEHLGFTVLEACDGKEGVDLYAERADEITAILLDLTMPKMMGDRAYAELRRLHDDVPIIIMSGYPAAAVSEQFAQDACARFLAKPFRAQTLTQTLRSLVPLDTL